MLTFNVAIARKDFIDDIIHTLLKHDISIFGSAVSIGYRSEYFKRRFYDARLRQNYYEQDDNILFQPKNVGRFDFPNDIDCFIPDSNQGRMQELIRETTVFRVINTKSVNKYTELLAGSKVKTVKFTVRPHVPDYVERAIGDTLDVDIDFVFGLGGRDPPFKTVDFRCNGLILDQTGYRISKVFMEYFNPFDRVELLTEILKEVVEYKAVTHNIVSFTPEFKRRTQKMLENNWIVMEKMCYVFTPGEEEKDDTCAICCDSLPIEAIRRGCCKTSYHSGCYMAMRAKFGVCPGCKADISN